MALENGTAVPNAVSTNVESEGAERPSAPVCIADEAANFNANEIAFPPLDELASHILCPLTGNPIPAFLLDAAVCGEDLKHALAKAAEIIDHDDPLFLKWADKVNTTVAAAYPLALQIFNMDRPARIAFLKSNRARGYQRLPNANNPWLIALVHCARPTDEDERKLRSSYGLLLAYAAAKSIAPDEFMTRMRGVTLCKAQAEVRAMKKASKSTADGNDHGSRVVKFSVDFRDGSKVRRGTVSLDEQTYGALQGRNDPSLDAAQWAHLLRALANAMPSAAV